MSAPRIPRVPAYTDELRHENDALRAQVRDLEGIVRRLLVAEGESEAALRIADRACVAILRRYADAAEHHLAAAPSAPTPAAARERLCPCGIREPDCLCPLRRSR